MRTPTFLSGRKRWLAVTAALVLASALGGAAAASVSATAPPPATAYTGCLGATGNLSNGAPGASPLHPCAHNERLVHLSGITYGAGGGLTLAPSHVFSLKSAYTLPQRCGLGESPVRNARGTWSCAGLALADQKCPRGKFADGIDGVGGLTCVAPPRETFTGPDLWVTRMPNQQDTPQSIEVTVATLSLPAGTFLIQANGVANTVDTSRTKLDLDCRLDGSTTGGTDAIAISDLRLASFSLTDVRSLASPGDIHLNCINLDPGTFVDSIIVTALKIGTVH
jgi:hypothetical protein